jgi:hypothetical protein
MREEPRYVDNIKTFTFIIPEIINIILLRSEINTNNFGFSTEIQVKLKVDITGPETS